MKQIAKHIFLPVLVAFSFLVRGMIDYSRLLKTQGFSVIDLVFVIVIPAVSFFFCGWFYTDELKVWQKLTVLMAIMVTLVALILAWFVLPEGSRVYELLHNVGGFTIAGGALGWARARLRVVEYT
jgi:hypothetical protein